jgi:hypothetical protein
MTSSYLSEVSGEWRRSELTSESLESEELLTREKLAWVSRTFDPLQSFAGISSDLGVLITQSFPECWDCLPGFGSDLQ